MGTESRSATTPTIPHISVGSLGGKKRLPSVPDPGRKFSMSGDSSAEQLGRDSLAILNLLILFANQYCKLYSISLWMIPMAGNFKKN
jgi:hypothetical protein